MNPATQDSGRHRPRRSPASHGGFVPLLLLALALVSMTAFQTLQLQRERVRTQHRLTRLEQALKDAAKVHKQLDAIARGVALLARQGNANARQTVAQLRRLGVTIHPDAGPKGQDAAQAGP